MNTKNFLQDHLQFLLVCYLVQIAKTAQLFFMRPAKRLNATAITIHEGVIREHCMGMCFLHDVCKSFNAYQSKGVHVCEILKENRCDRETKLIDEPGTSYMDMVAEGECPSKWKSIFYGILRTRKNSVMLLSKANSFL